MLGQLTAVFGQLIGLGRGMRRTDDVFRHLLIGGSHLRNGSGGLIRFIALTIQRLRLRTGKFG
ncbi:hypothetical protein D3C86_2000270 [compost metagenome]